MVKVKIYEDFEVTVDQGKAIVKSGIVRKYARALIKALMNKHWEPVSPSNPWPDYAAAQSIAEFFDGKIIEATGKPVYKPNVIY